MSNNNVLKFYYHIAGGHTHVRVFMNGAKCGDLVFRNEEFQQLAGGPRVEDEFICDWVPRFATGRWKGSRMEVTCIREGSPAEREAELRANTGRGTHDENYGG